MLKQDIQSNISFKEIKEEYNKAKQNNNIVEKQKQIEKFYKALFRKNCDDFNKILYYDNEELHAIESMLCNPENRMKYLKSLNQKSLDRLLEITNSIKFQHNNKGLNFNMIVKYINSDINFIKLMPSLKMDVSFSEIWHRQYGEKKSIQEWYIEKFCEHLVGNDGKNLETILSCTNYIDLELNTIHNMLCGGSYAKRYLLDVFEYNDNLFQKVSNIVENTKAKNDDAQKVIDQMKTIILFRNLNINVSFHEIYYKYDSARRDEKAFISDRKKEVAWNAQNEQIEKFIEYLFIGNNGKNLREILLHCPSTDELVAIDNMLKDNDIQERVAELFTKNRKKYRDIISDIEKSVSNDSLYQDIVRKIKGLYNKNMK